MRFDLRPLRLTTGWSEPNAVVSRTLSVLCFPGKSYIRFICLFVSKCLQFYFYSGQTDRHTLSFIYIDRFTSSVFYCYKLVVGSWQTVV